MPLKKKSLPKQVCVTHSHAQPRCSSPSSDLRFHQLYPLSHPMPASPRRDEGFPRHQHLRSHSPNQGAVAHAANTPLWTCRKGQTHPGRNAANPPPTSTSCTPHTKPSCMAWLCSTCPGTTSAQKPPAAPYQRAPGRSWVPCWVPCWVPKLLATR